MSEQKSDQGLVAATAVAARINKMLAAKGVSLNTKKRTEVMPVISGIKPYLQPPPSTSPQSVSREVNINHTSSAVRAMLTRSSFQEQLAREYKVVLTVKGKYIPPQDAAQVHSFRPLYLSIVAPSQHAMQLVMEKIDGIINGGSSNRSQVPVLNSYQDHSPTNHPTSETILGTTIRDSDDALSSIPRFPLPVTVATSRPPVQPKHVPSFRQQEKVYIGLTSVPGFDVMDNLKGPNNSYFDHITHSTNSSLILRGRGSGYLEPTSGKEAFEALHIFVSHQTTTGLQEAKKLCENLRDSVKNQLEIFKQTQNIGSQYNTIGSRNYGYNPYPNPAQMPQNSTYPSQHASQTGYSSYASQFRPPPPPPPPTIPSLDSRADSTVDSTVDCLRSAPCPNVRSDVNPTKKSTQCRPPHAEPQSLPCPSTGQPPVHPVRCGRNNHSQIHVTQSEIPSPSYVQSDHREKRKFQEAVVNIPLPLDSTHCNDLKRRRFQEKVCNPATQVPKAGSPTTNDHQYGSVSSPQKDLSEIGEVLLGDKVNVNEILPNSSALVDYGGDSDSD
eukprot:CFRG3556T1